MTRRSPTTGAIVMALGLLAGACGGGDGAAPADVTTTTQPESAPTTNAQDLVTTSTGPDAVATLETSLSGAAEVPGPGDPDGRGTARLRVDRQKREICFELSVSGIGPATAAHIHKGRAGQSGDIEVPLTPAPTNGSSQGCVPTEGNFAAVLVGDPVSYYVNVHNAEFPGGAVRGQLGPR